MSEEAPQLMSADQMSAIREMIREGIAAMFRQAVETNRPFGQIAAALAAAQGDFAPITRSREVEVTMKSGGKYRFRYAPLDEVINATRPALSRNQIALVQIVTGVAGRADMRVHTKLLHASGELLESVVDVKRPEEVQQLGSIITYIRRYTITAILGVASEDDDDGNAADGNDREDPRSRAPVQAGPRTFVELMKAITAAPERSYLEWLSTTEIAGELNAEQRAEARVAATARTAQLQQTGKPAAMADEIAERERAKAAAKASQAKGAAKAAPVTISCRECSTEIKVNGLVIDASAVGDMCGRCCAQAEGRR